MNMDLAGYFLTASFGLGAGIYIAYELKDFKERSEKSNKEHYALHLVKNEYDALDRIRDAYDYLDNNSHELMGFDQVTGNLITNTKRSGWSARSGECNGPNEDIVLLNYNNQYALQLKLYNDRGCRQEKPDIIKLHDYLSSLEKCISSHENPDNIKL